MREQDGNTGGTSAGFTAPLPHERRAGQGDSPGFVYFVRAGRTHSVKIGWAIDPERRVEALQTGSCHKLHLIGFAPGEPADETDWHYRYAHLRERGEWFRLGNDLRHAINDRLGEAGATQYIHVKTDWRQVRQIALLNEERV